MTSRPRPDLFLIVKEPPFPASYEKTVYIQRTLDELAPQHSRYSRASRLAIQALRSGTYATIHAVRTLALEDPYFYRLTP